MLSEGTGIKGYLMLLRVHTASLTQACMLIGWFLSSGSILSIHTILWALFGILYHATGFLHNNLCDYKHDIRDKYKKSHPLVNGSIGIHTAYQLNIVLHTVTVSYGLVLVQCKPLPTLLLLFTVLCGWVYNWICKKSIIAPVFISLCFGLLVAVPYTTYKSVSSLLVLVILYSVSQIWYQISVEGYLKDIEHDSVNLLYKMGARVSKGRLTINGKVWLFAVVSKLPMGITGFLIVYYYYTTVGLIAVILGLIGVFYSMRVLFSYKWVHSRVVRHCAITEVVTYLTLVYALYGVLGFYNAVLLTVYPLLWFIAWNRYYWGTVLRPKV